MFFNLFLFREVFLEFDPVSVSKLNEKKICSPGTPGSSLLSEMKLRNIVENARQVCKVCCIRMVGVQHVLYTSNGWISSLYIIVTRCLWRGKGACYTERNPCVVSTHMLFPDDPHSTMKIATCFVSTDCYLKIKEAETI